MSNKKSNKKVQSRYDSIFRISTILGILWQVVWVFVLASMGRANFVLWPLLFGSFIIALAGCLRLAPRYNKVTLFILAGTILICVLSYLAYIITAIGFDVYHFEHSGAV